MFSIIPQKTKKCPRCHSTDLIRIRRTVLDRLLSFGSDIRKYRCEKCFHNFFVYMGNKKQKDQSPAIQTEL